MASLPGVDVVARARAEVRLRRETVEAARTWAEHSLNADDGEAINGGTGLRFVSMLVVEMDRRDKEMASLGESLMSSMRSADMSSLWKRLCKRWRGRSRVNHRLAIQVQEQRATVRAVAVDRGEELIRMQRAHEANVDKRKADAVELKAERLRGDMFAKVLHVVLDRAEEAVDSDRDPKLFYAAPVTVADIAKQVADVLDTYDR